MKKQLLIIVFFLLPGVFGFSQQFYPISITGFNEDVVAETTPADQTTSITFDHFGTVFYKNGFPGGSYGMPQDGKIISEANPEITYQLADYENDNCLHLRGDNLEGVLTLNQPGWYEQISFLAASAEGVSKIEVTLNYSDGATQFAEEFTIPDWFGGVNYAIKGLDRVSRSNDVVDNNSTNPRLYDFIIEDVNPEKLLESISFKKITEPAGDKRAGIFAVSGVGEPEPKPVPLSNWVFILLFVMMTLFVVLRMHK